MNEKALARVKRWLPPLLAAAGAYLALRYLLPFFLPFLLAFAAALLLDRPLRFLTRRLKLNRAFAAATLELLFLGALLGLLFFLGTRVLTAAENFLHALPEHFSALSTPLSGVEARMDAWISTLPEDAAGLLRTAKTSLQEELERLPGQIYAGLFSALSAAAGKAPSLLFRLAIFALSLFFLCSGWEEVRSFLTRQLSPALREKTRLARAEVFSALKSWLSAQLRLMSLTFIELSLAFFFMGVSHSMLAAAAVAMIDALPLFGTGTVLLPWAVGCFLLGEVRQTIFLLLTYAVVSLVRSLLEPRLLGSQSGLHPAATLLAIYCGWRLAGVWGMLLFPPGLMVLKQFNDRSLIKLWK